MDLSYSDTGLVLQAEQACMCPGHDAFRHVMEGRAGLAVASIITGGGTRNCASLPAQLSGVFLPLALA